MTMVELEVRDVYGTPTAYPANEAARIFTQMLGTKTLTKRVLEFVDALNFEIVLQNYPGVYWDEYRNSRDQELA